MDSIIKTLVTTTSGTEKDLQKLYKDPKHSMPVLLSFFSSKDTNFVGCLDTLSSTLLSGHMTYVGIKAALIIEWILSENKNDFRLCGKFNTHFQRGIIIKENDKFSTLNYSDIQIIGKLYLNYWNKNKAKDILVLRKQFTRFKTVLAASKYEWI